MRNSSFASNESQQALLPELFDSRGELDIVKAFQLIQLIRQAHGNFYLTDEYIEENLLPAECKHDGESNNEEKLLAYKWIQVMRFMKKNPHILK